MDNEQMSIPTNIETYYFASSYYCMMDVHDIIICARTCSETIIFYLIVGLSQVRFLETVFNWFFIQLTYSIPLFLDNYLTGSLLS